MNDREPDGAFHHESKTMEASRRCVGSKDSGALRHRLYVGTQMGLKQPAAQTTHSLMAGVPTRNQALSSSVVPGGAVWHTRSLSRCGTGTGADVPAPRRGAVTLQVIFSRVKAARGPPQAAFIHPVPCLLRLASSEGCHRVSSRACRTTGRVHVRGGVLRELGSLSRWPARVHQHSICSRACPHSHKPRPGSVPACFPTPFMEPGPLQVTAPSSKYGGAALHMQTCTKHTCT